MTDGASLATILPEDWRVRIIDHLPSIWGRDVRPEALRDRFGGDLTSRLVSCPKCRRLVIRLDLLGHDGRAMISALADPPNHWILAFWSKLTDFEFWSLSKQDFTGWGTGDLHRCYVTVPFVRF